MAYVDKTIGASETVVRRGRFPLSYHVVSWLALIFLGVILIGIYLFVARYVRAFTTEVALTNHRIIRKTGVFSRHEREFSLDDIEHVNLEQSIWGRLFNYGHLNIQGTGDDSMDLPPLRHPLAFRQALENARHDIEARHPMSAPVEGEATEGPGETAGRETAGRETAGREAAARPAARDAAS
jgi:uncharacterized membrane protein YdbT with pleckstrin-like domain